MQVNAAGVHAGLRRRRREGRLRLPPYDLDKVVSKKFADSGSPAADLVKNFNWTNDDQNVVAKYIAVTR